MQLNFSLAFNESSFETGLSFCIEVANMDDRPAEYQRWSMDVLLRNQNQR